MRSCKQIIIEKSGLQRHGSRDLQKVQSRVSHLQYALREWKKTPNTTITANITFSEQLSTSDPLVLFISMAIFHHIRGTQSIRTTKKDTTNKSCTATCTPGE
mmetsp:Transcript_8860/g.26550  ORF Transcript_8860/g.26550 Transcript_8860/m.26550 type:complete len:102 (-) Transcript_8860:776-1081(-)